MLLWLDLGRNLSNVCCRVNPSLCPKLCSLFQYSGIEIWHTIFLQLHLSCKITNVCWRVNPALCLSLRPIPELRHYKDATLEMLLLRSGCGIIGTQALKDGTQCFHSFTSAVKFVIFLISNVCCRVNPALYPIVWGLFQSSGSIKMPHNVFEAQPQLKNVCCRVNPTMRIKVCNLIQCLDTVRCHVMFPQLHISHKFVMFVAR